MDIQAELFFSTVPPKRGCEDEKLHWAELDYALVMWAADRAVWRMPVLMECGCLLMTVPDNPREGSEKPTPRPKGGQKRRSRRGRVKLT